MKKLIRKITAGLLMFALVLSSSSLAFPSVAKAATGTTLTVIPSSTVFSAKNINGVSGDSAPGFSSGSFASDGTGKTDMYFTPVSLFGRDIKLGEISSFSYWTKKDSTHVSNPADWFVNIYTKPYAEDVSSNTWYGDRIGTEPYFAMNLNDPANTWNKWTTLSAESGPQANQLRFFESTDGPTGSTFGSYADPIWDNFINNNAISGQPYKTRDVLFISPQTGSGTAEGFTGQIDGFHIELTDGSWADVNFELTDTPPPAPTANVSATKLVCDSESDLPNWGNNNGPDITATTAANYVASHDGCEIVPWQFEWSHNGVGNPGDNVVASGTGWTSFASTATIPVGEPIWFREKVNNDYIPFSSAILGNDNMESETSMNSAEFYCGNDVLNYDNWEYVDSVANQTYHCVAFNVLKAPVTPPTSAVTICKADDKGNNLSGWTMMLKGDDVQTGLSVPSNTSAGVNSMSLLAGTSYIAKSMGTWMNQGGANPVDTEYSTTNGWSTHMDGYTGYSNDILELQINNSFDPNSNWGAYNSMHNYVRSFVPVVNGAANFRIFDGNGTTQEEGWFGDNVGNLTVDISKGYAGITGENGCTTFTGVPYGNYAVGEVMQDNWTNVSGLGNVSVDGTTETFNVVNKDTSVAETESGSVHVFKYVDGVQATSLMTGSTAFPIKSTTDGVDGTSTLWYNLDNDGHRPGDIPYEASTLTYPGGFTYQLNEELSMANTGTACNELKPNYTDKYKEYALVGYSWGHTLGEAEAMTPVTTSPSLVIDGDWYVIVHNKKCTDPAPTPTGPVINFLGFRDQSNGGYDNVPAVNVCGATNESGYIAWEWALTSDPEPMSYTYKITSGPTAVGFTASTSGTYYNGGIPMEGTYAVEVVGKDNDNNLSNTINCSVVYKKATTQEPPVQVCTEKSMDIVSDETDQTDGSIAAMQTFVHGAWSNITGAKWIWNGFNVATPLMDETVHFTKSFIIPGTVKSANLEVLADNEYTGTLNSLNFNGSISTDATFGNDFNNLHTYDVKNDLVNGSNNLAFTVKNWAQENGTAETNPAGLNYKLHVTYDECVNQQPPSNTPPTITLNNAGYTSFTLPSTYTENGATGADVDAGDTVTVTQTGTPTTTAGSTFTITYTATDSHGATAQVTRTVTVNAAPVVTEPETEQPTDVCPNIDGNQATVPSGKHLSDGQCVNDVVINTLTTNNEGGGGGAVLPSFFAAPKIGKVLGESTTCGIYLDKFLRKGYKNDPEAVKKIQQFLNDYFGLNIPVTGFFGPMTDVAVKKFQLKFADDILKPWNSSTPTGIVYLTTTTKINQIMCPELNLQNPTLIPFEQNPDAPKP